VPEIVGITTNTPAKVVLTDKSVKSINDWIGLPNPEAMLEVTLVLGVLYVQLKVDVETPDGIPVNVILERLPVHTVGLKIPDTVGIGFKIWVTVTVWPIQPVPTTEGVIK
jgi:hypothetical protein